MVRLLVVAIFCCAFPLTTSGEDWPAWRGPRGDGTSNETEWKGFKWNGTTGEGITWKTPVPGVGHSSPVVVGGKVFLTSCLLDSDERVLQAFDVDSGKPLWSKTVLKAPLEKKHELNSFASSTPASDGKSIYVAFLEPDFASTVERTPGNMVVASYDLDGNEQWMVKPGRFASVHGFCSCPVIFENLLIVNGDHDGDSYIVALERDTGKEVWKIERENKTRSYVTPIIRTFAGRLQMILSGTKMVASYDPRTGKELWRMKGPTEQFVASMVDDGKYLFLTAGFPEHHVLCIDPTGSGDVTDTHIVWRTTRNCSYVPAPVICRSESDEGTEVDCLLVVSDEGIGTSFVAESGKVLWRERLGPHYSASPITVAGKVLFTSDLGVTKVIDPGKKKLQVVAENPLDQRVFGSAAVSNGKLFLRGENDLFCITPQ